MPATQETAVTINPKLIVPFVNSVRSVFSTMVGMATILERPHVKTQPATTFDVSSIIGFSGEFVGSMVLSFQQATAMAIVANFAGAPVPPDSPDFADAVGELANMIAGSAKTSFGGGTNISVPSIIMGVGHTIARLHDVPCLVIPCHTPAGDFAVEVNIKPLLVPRS